MTKDSIPQTMVCRGECGRELPFTPEYFTRNKGRKYGLEHTCKQCAAARSKQYYSEHKEEKKEYQRRYAAEHADEVKQYHRTYYANNREAIINKMAQWRIDNPERARETSRNNYINNKDHRLELDREWRANNPEKSKEIKDRWVNNNPERKREVGRNYARRNPQKRVEWRTKNPEKYAINNKRSKHKRRALMVEIPGEYTRQDILDIYADQHGRCAYCGITLYWGIPNDIHLDHVIPITKGGTNWPDNLVLTCESCNCSKQDKSIVQWQLTRGW